MTAMNNNTAQQGKYLVLMELHRPNSKGYDCLSWYTRPNEEQAGGIEFALQMTIQRMVAYNLDRQLFGKIILVYTAPKRDGDKPVGAIM
ncbi:hypothetical protein FACS189456_2930 [Bacteroidia bacterium]|nr:hypothetical protein FACS189456_2930 [Bacteroidia bacterium]